MLSGPVLQAPREHAGSAAGPRGRAECAGVSRLSMLRWVPVPGPGPSAEWFLLATPEHTLTHTGLLLVQLTEVPLQGTRCPSLARQSTEQLFKMDYPKFHTQS